MMERPHLLAGFVNPDFHRLQNEKVAKRGLWDLCEGGLDREPFGCSNRTDAYVGCSSMVRCQIELEVLAFVVDPITRYRSSLDRLTGLIGGFSVDRHLVDISTAAKREPAWPPLALF
jgi:hypothetical protein